VLAQLSRVRTSASTEQLDSRRCHITPRRHASVITW
jgi:hypothetical protein